MAVVQSASSGSADDAFIASDDSREFVAAQSEFHLEGCSKMLLKCDSEGVTISAISDPSAPTIQRVLSAVTFKDVQSDASMNPALTASGDRTRNADQTSCDSYCR
jgi:hypothetical protein